MPVKYAVRSKRSTPPTRGEQLTLQSLGYHGNEMAFEYEEVPFIVADMDKANGVYALFSHHDVKVSDWLRLPRTQKVEAAYEIRRKRSSPVLKDSICQDINPGDYVLSHDHSHKELELSKIIRNLKVNTVTEDLSGCHGESTLRTRNPDVYIRIPKEMVEGGELVQRYFSKRFAAREYLDRTGGYIFNKVDEAIALSHPTGYFGYFDEEGNNITGWISIMYSAHDELILDNKLHAKKKIVSELETPLKDAMGTDILLNDWVFSDDNHYNNFMLSKVIGFTKDRVRLAAYTKARFGSSQGVFANSGRGERIITLNWPKNIIKLPVTVS